MRRLPIYLLIDVSYSMAGKPLDAVQNGVKNLIVELRRNPYAIETAYLSVLTFSDDTKVEVELTELPLFQTPTFKALGRTALGKALSVLGKRISMEVKKSSSNRKGDWKPLIFIMTDGSPTDKWREGLLEFQKIETGIVVACAAGSSADTKVLQEITPHVVKLETADEESIGNFFAWVSSSIEVASTKIDSAGQDSYSLGELPPPPKGIDLVKY